LIEALKNKSYFSVLVG